MSVFPEVARALYDSAVDAGHATVGLVFARSILPGIPPPPPFRGFTQELVCDSPAELDVFAVSAKDRIAPAQRALEPDLVLSCYFPWKVPPEALAVPPLGIVNGHGAWLPDYRGPVAHAWALREGATEHGFTLHVMDEGLDTGPILARTTLPLDEDETPVTLRAKTCDAIRSLLPGVIERLAAGDSGEPQVNGRFYSFFEDEYLWIDWSRPAAEIRRQVLAWRFGFTREGQRGPFAELDGETVRVLRTRLEPAEGTRVECGDGPLWILETEAVETA
jgi:methionyl-tRNA formyltransferase